MRPGKFWKEICRKAIFVRRLCRTGKQFLASKSICVIQQPPYSPELAPADFFLFPKVKLALKGERFSDISDIQRGVTKQVKGVSLQDFHHAFEDLLSVVWSWGAIILKVCNQNSKYINSFFRNKCSFII
jgi:hypothetical protein